MSTIVAVRKHDQVCIAADSLTSFGDLKQAAHYDPHHDKLQRFGDTCIGIVGSAAHTLVIESVMQRKTFTPEFESRAAIFSTAVELHRLLKEHYFLNAKDDDEDPYESSRIDALIANRHGIFALYALREVYEYSRFWAIGAGGEYALGAMFAAYDCCDTAVDVARLGVEASAEFDNSTALPMTLQSYTLEAA
ncbi:MAG: MFS transporter [Gammaproteobacteria bacterium]|nr:MFS transporter [Gammaproteobacteria bacterium]